MLKRDKTAHKLQKTRLKMKGSVCSKYGIYCQGELIPMTGVVTFSRQSSRYLGFDSRGKLAGLLCHWVRGFSFAATAAALIKAVTYHCYLLGLSGHILPTSLMFWLIQKVSPLFHNKIEVFAERREAVLKSMCLTFWVFWVKFVSVGSTRHATVLTAEFDNPASGKKTQEGGEGGGHGSFWQHHMAHWRKTTTQTHKIQMRKGKLTTHCHWQSHMWVSKSELHVSELPYKGTII